LASRTLYEIIGFACGFALIDYGFNFMATGLPGARSLTSQFIGANLLVGGSAAVFISLFYMLRSDNVPSSAIPQIAAIVPDVRVETVVEEQTPIPEAAKPTLPSYAESLEVHLSEFHVLSPGDYEQHLAANVFDKIRIEAETVTIWREDRQGIRSIYLAGPYELKRKLMESYVERGEDLKIGYLSLSVETIRDLLALQQKPV
jgi:hypothetical protein